MAWMSREFECDSCGHEWYDIIDSKETHDKCPKCGKRTKFSLSAPNLALYSLQDKAGRKAIMQKRSTEHTIKEVSREAEKWGEAGINLSKMSGKIQSK
jgi:rRNA maturation protein Nop10